MTTFTQLSQNDGFSVNLKRFKTRQKGTTWVHNILGTRYSSPIGQGGH
jgi:hypothetical protein